MSEAGTDETEDHQWRRERLRVLMESSAELERRTIIANVVGTVLIVAAAQWLPNARDFLVPLLLRLIAILCNALLYDRIRKRMRASAGTPVPLRLAGVMAAFGGASWASLIIPVFMQPYLHPASYIVTTGVFIGVALILTNSAAITRIALPFAGGFVVTFLVAAAFTPWNTAVWLIGGLTFIATGIGTFCIGSARQRLDAADTLVENQRLSEELEEALARAEFFAEHDPLTGLFNRRALFERQMHLDAPGDKHHMLLIDLDNFKQVNDRFGHETGDRVLIGVAQVLGDFVAKAQGESHFAARLGGEEFAVFLAVSDEQEADRIAAQLHLAMSGIAIGLGLPPKLGTASIGISPMYRGEQVCDALHRADHALYQAKRDGRNRVCREAA